MTAFVFALMVGGTAMADVDTRLAEARQAIESRLSDSREPGLVIGITDAQRMRQVIAGACRCATFDRAHLPYADATR